MTITQKKEYRYQSAGQALQGILSNRVLFDNLKEQAEEIGLNFKQAIAIAAIDITDVLIEEIEKREAEE